MRAFAAVAASLLVAALACSTTVVTPATAVSACVTGGGECVPSTDTVSCVSFLSLACAAGLTCCSLADAGVELQVDAEDDGAVADAPVLGCADLAACCPAVPSSDLAACSSIVAAGDDVACATDLAGFEGSGYCGGTAVPADAATDAIADARHDATTGPSRDAAADAGRDAPVDSRAEVDAPREAGRPPADATPPREGGRDAVVDAPLADAAHGG